MLLSGLLLSFSGLSIYWCKEYPLPVKTSESHLRASRKWKAKHKVELKEYNHQWKEENKERIQSYKKVWGEQNREHRSEYDAEYRSNHPDIIHSVYEKRKQTRKERKIELVGLLGGVCSVCGYKPRHFCELDIHEADGPIVVCHGARRSATCPGLLLTTPTGYALLREHLDELVLLCANCHHRLSCGDCVDDMQTEINEFLERRKLQSQFVKKEMGLVGFGPTSPCPRRGSVPG